jgi:hypothetical protein
MKGLGKGGSFIQVTALVGLIVFLSLRSDAFFIHQIPSCFIWFSVH